MKPRSKAEHLWLVHTADEDGYKYKDSSSKTKKFWKRFLSKSRRRTDKTHIKEEMS